MADQRQRRTISTFPWLFPQTFRTLYKIDICPFLTERWIDERAPFAIPLLSVVVQAGGAMGSSGLKEWSFDPERVRAIIWAFDEACKASAEQPPSDQTQDILVGIVVGLAVSGVIDRESLRDAALKQLRELGR